MFAIPPRHASDPLTGETPVDYAYDGYGRPSSLTPGNGRVTAYSFDPVGRVSRVNNQGLVYTDFTYNPASQIVTCLLSNGNWAWDEGLNVDLDYEINNLNQYPEVGTTGFAYDLNGDLTDDGRGSARFVDRDRPALDCEPRRSHDRADAMVWAMTGLMPGAERAARAARVL